MSKQNKDKEKEDKILEATLEYVDIDDAEDRLLEIYKFLLGIED